MKSDSGMIRCFGSWINSPQSLFEHTVFDGTCRICFPKVDFDNGSPAHHPFNLKDNIWAWNYGGERGERGFTSFLIDTAHRVAATSPPTGPVFTLCRMRGFWLPNLK